MSSTGQRQEVFSAKKNIIRANIAVDCESQVRQSVSPDPRNDAKTCHVAQHDKFVNYLFNFCSDSSFGTITKSVQGSRFD